MIDAGVRANAADPLVRHSWDAVASDVARLIPDLRTEAPLDRAVLTAFVDMAEQAGPGVVADVGSGTGRVTAHLASAGLHMVGIDLSIGMAAVARATHPALGFAVAHAGALPVRSRSLAGIVAWYSLINLPTALLPAVFAEFARVMRPGAPAVIAFQCGAGERVDRSTAYGQAVPMTYYRHDVDDVLRALGDAAMVVHASVRREASLPHETTPQAFLLTHRGE